MCIEIWTDDKISNYFLQVYLLLGLFSCWHDPMSIVLSITVDDILLIYLNESSVLKNNIG